MEKPAPPPLQLPQLQGRGQLPQVPDATSVCVKAWVAAVGELRQQFVQRQQVTRRFREVTLSDDKDGQKSRTRWALWEQRAQDFPMIKLDRPILIEGCNIKVFGIKHELTGCRHWKV